MNKSAFCLFMVCVILCSCSVGDAQSKKSKAGSHSLFVIKDDVFKASDVCDGKGSVILRMENDELKGAIEAGYEVIMRKDSMPAYMWCHGAKHIWNGKAKYKDYTFESNSDDPLQFVVDRDKGYHDEKGKGTVTLPNGKVTSLP